MTMRVVVCCDWFLKYAAEQAIGLAEAGANVALVCRDHAHEFGGDAAERQHLLSRVSSRNVEVLTLDGPISSRASWPATVRLHRQVRKWRPDVVQAHVTSDPRLLLAVSSAPIVLTVHDPIPHPGAAPVIGWRAGMRRTWLRRAARVVVHGERLRQELAIRYPKLAISVVPHGMEPRSAPLLPPERRAVLLFGRLEAYKGVGVLLAAMERLWQQGSDVQLVIAGDGPEAVMLPDTDSRIDCRIGYLPEDAVEELFSRASLVALPYEQASQSGVGLLALGRGIPVVVTDTGSLPELAYDESFVCPPGDPEALAGILARHLDHGAGLRGAVLERARGRFSWEAVGRQSLDVYRRVIVP